MNKSEIYSQITMQLAAGEFAKANVLIDSSQAQLSAAEYQECLGNRCFYMKQFQEAIHFYEAAIESSPEYDCARYHYFIGLQAERKGELTEAFDRYQAAIEIEPSFVDSYIDLGGLLGKVEDFRGALQCYSDAIKLDPFDLAIYYNRVQVLSKLAQEDPAVYTDKLQKAQLEYDEAKQSLDPPASNRVW